MTLQRIAAEAGVSISTVSRVVNEAPGITESTIQAVHRAMKALNYTPTRRQATRRVESVAGRRVAFYVLAGPQQNTTPAYDKLLRGLSSAASRHQLELTIGFVDDPQTAFSEILHRHPDGLLLHGRCPSPSQTRALHRIPTVWLMANALRPHWGDQVMPDNMQVGQLAAEYLLGRGHRHLVYFGLNSGWSLNVRAMAFSWALEARDLSPRIINPSLDPGQRQSLRLALKELVEACQTRDPRPTGLFVAEDWMLHHVYNALDVAGIQPGADLDIISCNNDRPHLVGLSPQPATIDIRFEQIAQQGMDRLVTLMRGPARDDRLRVMLEPFVVPPLEDWSDAPPVGSSVEAPREAPAAPVAGR